MTKFSFEVPIKHMEEFDDLQDFYFTLNHLYKNHAYISYMVKVRNKGEKTIWLDNSYNELLHAEPLDAMVSVANVIHPSKVISPDSPKWSKELIAEAYDDALSFFHPAQLIVVVKDVEMHRYMADRTATHFAVSYWNRPIPQQKQLMPCHFLGLLNPQEIKEFKPPTCDTSMPIKLAIQSKTIDDWRKEGYPHIYTHELGIAGNDYFNTTMTKKQIWQARQNIKELKEECNG